MGKNRSLRAAIYAQYDNESDLAKALGWPKQRLNKITNGKHVPTITEAEALSHCLQIDIATVANFFNQLVTTRATRERNEFQHDPNQRNDTLHV
jgi:transcriptional regulator with XRE-family HTH domain